MNYIIWCEWGQAQGEDALTDSAEICYSGIGWFSDKKSQFGQINRFYWHFYVILRPKNDRKWDDHEKVNLF